MFGKFTSKFIYNIMLFIVGLSLVLFLCRVVFIVDIGYFGSLFAKSQTGVSGDDVLLTIFNGLRYDGRIVGAISLFYIALYVGLLRVNRRHIILTVFSMILVFIIIAASVGNQAFYKIFGDTYNIIFLDLIYGDRHAIFNTALSGEYNIIFRFGVIFGGTMLFGHFYYRLVKLADKARPWNTRISAISCGFLAYLILLMMSSTISLRGGSIDHLISPAKNSFLRKATPGALQNLYLVYKTHLGLEGYSFENINGKYHHKKIDGTKIAQRTWLSVNSFSGKNHRL